MGPGTSLRGGALSRRRPRAGLRALGGKEIQQVTSYLAFIISLSLTHTHTLFLSLTHPLSLSHTHTLGLGKVFRDLEHLFGDEHRALAARARVQPLARRTLPRMVPD